MFADTIRPVLVFLVVLFLGTVPLRASDEQSAAAASVNGVIITRSYLEREIRRFEQQIYDQAQMPDEEQLARIPSQTLDTLIDIELLYQESQQRGFQVSSERLEEQLSGLRARFADESAFAEALEQFGISEEELAVEFRRQIAIQDMINADIVSSVTVGDQETRDYYEDNRQHFMTPEHVRARHILIRVSPDASAAEKEQALARIEEIRIRILQGEDFAELAGELSEDGSSAGGGDLGYFSREQMVEPFAEVAFSLEIGVLSGVVTTEFGYHLIEVTDRTPPHVIPYEELEPRIEEFLQREKVLKVIEDLVGRLRSVADIVIY